MKAIIILALIGLAAYVSIYVYSKLSVKWYLKRRAVFLGKKEEVLSEIKQIDTLQMFNTVYPIVLIEFTRREKRNWDSELVEVRNKLYEKKIELTAKAFDKVRSD